jgi:hypothetical protein
MIINRLDFYKHSWTDCIKDHSDLSCSIYILPVKWTKMRLKCIALGYKFHELYRKNYGKLWVLKSRVEKVRLLRNDTWKNRDKHLRTGHFKYHSDQSRWTVGNGQALEDRSLQISFRTIAFDHRKCASNGGQVTSYIIQTDHIRPWEMGKCNFCDW